MCLARRLQSIRDLALFNLAIDSMLRSCDLVRLSVSDISHGDGIQSRAQIIQKKTKTPVQFEITAKTKTTLNKLIEIQHLGFNDFLFQSRCKKSEHLSTRQYARIVDSWVSSIGLDKAAYGTHSMRRTKASIIYRETKNLRAIQILLGHSKIDSTIRYLGVEVDDALDLAERIQV
ncbi:integrase [Oleiphilus sp. HI0078]|uniref:tyrosine-type recombinase/integrase n=1 Tax=Oleiphilus sp. HI0043 TaxID=1822233 RepID=UPI0007C28303|nr:MULTISPECIES: tyrosine-type recombinase/integrase [unclassified Oleiphilus]KZY73177.1 integrase [Oleiphilus sp. HI0068]KZY80649.1 integrase [Oleiphilus sp. HI0069]KZY85355.1 integrase [Oleiphilus sp. HI0072]KZZ20068.1 integrase [Oleiphilus sp. HI0078]KZZ43566.1 integrase [Oleiphilus sp. HI0085]